MLISEIMTRTVEIASPEDTIREAAQRMLDHDIGFMPVGEDDKLVGMVTDRDIVTRGVAAGLDGSGKVRDVMTKDVKYCIDSDEIDDVATNMGDIQVRRLVVVDDDKQLCGVVSLADTIHANKLSTGTAFSGVVRPGGSHTQDGA